MLVLTRKTDEQITIGDNVNVVVLSIHGNRVRLGITAPTEVTISRRPSTTTIPDEHDEESASRPLGRYRSDRRAVAATVPGAKAGLLRKV